MEELREFFDLSKEVSFTLATRYAMVAGVAWALGYFVFRRQWAHRKVAPKYPERKSILREMRYSALSVAIFGSVAAATILAARQGWTQLYWNLDAYPRAWFWTSILLAILLHDTWFYWSHRALHHPKLFRYAHRIHHLSRNPSPWAAYSFDPLEAVVQATIFPLTVILMPMHPYAFGLFMLWQILYNVYGHTGYEVWPQWMMQSPLGKILNTPTNHIMHHETMRGNFGLYFNCWDRMMGTNHPDYERRFVEVTTRPRNGRASGEREPNLERDEGYGHSRRRSTNT